jgi:hypothetical protein
VLPKPPQVSHGRPIRRAVWRPQETGDGNAALLLAAAGTYSGEEPSAGSGLASKCVILTGWGMSSGFCILIRMMRLRLAEAAFELENRISNISGPSGRCCGRRLVISAMPRACCSIFNMFTLVAMHDFLEM